MKTPSLFWLILILSGVVISGKLLSTASPWVDEQIPENRPVINQPAAATTLIPTVSPSVVVTDTPESRVLPPVGSNAGLVIAASVLVLIIIIGVLSFRRKTKH